MASYKPILKGNGQSTFFWFLLWYNDQVSNVQSVGSHRLLCVTCKPYHWKLKRFSRGCKDVHVASSGATVVPLFLGFMTTTGAIWSRHQRVNEEVIFLLQTLKTCDTCTTVYCFLTQEYFAVKLTS